MIKEYRERTKVKPDDAKRAIEIGLSGNIIQSKNFTAYTAIRCLAADKRFIVLVAVAKTAGIFSSRKLYREKLKPNIRLI